MGWGGEVEMMVQIFCLFSAYVSRSRKDTSWPKYCEILDFELDTVIKPFGLFPWRGYAYILHMGRKVNLLSNDQKGRLLSLVSSAHDFHVGALSVPLAVRWAHVTSSGKWVMNLNDIKTLLGQNF